MQLLRLFNALYPSARDVRAQCSAFGVLLTGEPVAVPTYSAMLTEMADRGNAINSTASSLLTPIHPAAVPGVDIADRLDLALEGLNPSGQVDAFRAASSVGGYNADTGGDAATDPLRDLLNWATPIVAAGS